jgi:hypothetical protein
MTLEGFGAAVSAAGRQHLFRGRASGILQHRCALLAGRFDDEHRIVKQVAALILKIEDLRNTRQSSDLRLQLLQRLQSLVTQSRCCLNLIERFHDLADLGVDRVEGAFAALLRRGFVGGFNRLDQRLDARDLAVGRRIVAYRLQVGQCGGDSGKLEQDVPVVGKAAQRVEQLAPGRKLRFVEADDIMDILAGVQPVAFRAQHCLDELGGVTDRELLADADNGRVDHGLARMVLDCGGLHVAF